MLLISVWQVVLRELVVYVFPNLGIRVSANDENVVIWAATNKGGQLIRESDEFNFFTYISRAIAGDDCCAGVAIERGYHHPKLYFLYAILWF